MSQARKVEQSTGAKDGGFSLFQALFLFGIWLLLSGKIDFFHVGSGIFAVLLVVWLDRKLGSTNLGKMDLPLRPHPLRCLLYVIWLIGQMLLSSWQVARIVMTPKMPLNPVLVRFTSPQPHTVARVVLGNSITLTPGTLTLDIDGDRYLVHALSDASKDGLLAGDMQRKVAHTFCADEYGAVADPEIVVGEIRGGIPG